MFYKHVFPFHSTCSAYADLSPLLPITTDFSSDDATYTTDVSEIMPPIVPSYILSSPSLVSPTKSHITYTFELAPLHRHSTRQRKPPSWLDDFVVNVSVANNNMSPPHNSLSTLNAPTAYTPYTYPYTISPSFKPAYVNFLANVSSMHEPYSYSQAKKAYEWVQAMNQELEALERNKTWKIT